MSAIPVPFDDFEALSDIVAEQKDLIEVFLEGQQDLDLFAGYWFPNLLDRIDFKRPPRGGGCVAVLDAVKRARARGGVPAYGVVDRDVWRRLKKVATLFEPDDASYLATPLSDGVYVTLYWEIEAYLLRPEILHGWSKTLGATAPRAPYAPGELIERICGTCACLMEVAALNVVLHHLEQRELERFAWGQDDPVVVEGLVRDKILRLLGPSPHGHEAEIGALTACLATLRQHAGGLSGAARMEFMLRFVDTKVLIARIVDACGIADGRVWPLAQNMLDAGLHPVELDALMKSICARHAGRP